MDGKLRVLTDEICLCYHLGNRMNTMSKHSNKLKVEKTLAKTVFSYTVNFIPAEEGGYTVEVPVLPGCITEGDTFEEAERNAREAITVYLESLLMDKEPIPQESGVISGRITVSRRSLRV